MAVGLKLRAPLRIRVPVEVSTSLDLANITGSIDLVGAAVASAQGLASLAGIISLQAAATAGAQAVAALHKAVGLSGAAVASAQGSSTLTNIGDGADIVALSLTSPSNKTNAPWTFGQPFKQATCQLAPQSLRTARRSSLSSRMCGRMAQLSSLSSAVAKHFPLARQHRFSSRVAAVVARRSHWLHYRH